VSPRATSGTTSSDEKRSARSSARCSASRARADEHRVGDLGDEQRAPVAQHGRQPVARRPVGRVAARQLRAQRQHGGVAVHRGEPLHARRPRPGRRRLDHVHRAPVAEPRHRRVGQRAERGLVVERRREQPARLGHEARRVLGAPARRDVAEHHRHAVRRRVDADVEPAARRGAVGLELRALSGGERPADRLVHRAAARLGDHVGQPLAEERVGRPRQERRRVRVHVGEAQLAVVGDERVLDGRQQRRVPLGLVQLRLVQPLPLERQRALLAERREQGARRVVEARGARGS
jgi:hypothetical protein